MSTLPPRSPETRTLRDGTRLTVVPNPQTLERLYSVVVGSELGWTHDRCVSDDGHEQRLDEGAAHLTEHVVLWSRFHEEITALEQQDFASVNGRVDAERTWWWAKDAGTEGRGLADAIATTARRVVSLFVSPPRDEALERMLDRSRDDVELEIGYRQGRADYDLTSALARALYPQQSLGAAPLGTTASLSRVDTAQQEIALCALAHGVRSVAVELKDPTPALADEVAEAVEETLAARADVARWRAAPPSAPAGAPVELNAVEREWESGMVAGAFEVPPLLERFPDAGERARALLITHLLRWYGRTRSGLWLAPSVRVYLAKAIVRDPWLVMHDDRRQLRAAVRRALADIRVDVERRAAEAPLLEMFTTRFGLLRLAGAADEHDLALTDVLAVAEELDTRDVDALAEELESPRRSAQVYFGPALV